MRTPPSPLSSQTHEPAATTTGRRHHRWVPPLRLHSRGETLSSEPPPPLTYQIASLPPCSALGATPHRPHHWLGQNQPTAAGAAMGSKLPNFACGLPSPTRAGPARSGPDEQSALAFSGLVSLNQIQMFANFLNS
jgi:hypothetical protein